MWIEKIEIKDIRTEERTDLVCGELYQNQVGVTSFKASYNYDELAVDYAMYAKFNPTFEPLDFDFKAYVDIENMDFFKAHLRAIDNHFKIVFTYNGTEYSVYADLSSEELSQVDVTDLEEFNIKFRTRTHFMKVKDFPFQFADEVLDHIGDPLAAELAFKLDNSQRNSTDEAFAPFQVEGDYPAFLAIQMYGSMDEDITYSNPAFGLNRKYDQTIDSYESKNIPMHKGDVLEINSFPLFRKITKNGVNVDGDRYFKNHRTFLKVDNFTKDNNIVFSNVLGGNIKVYSQFVLPR